MATLKNIRPSILDLPAEEVIQIHLAIRESRQTSKRPQTKVKEKKIAERKGLMNLLDGMTEQEMDELIRKMEEA